MNRSVYLALMIGLISFLANAQDSFVITGTVINPSTGDAVPFATVRSSDGQVGTVSDRKGKFTLSVPATTRALKISSVGFSVMEVAVNSSSNELTIELVESIKKLPEFVLETQSLAGGRQGLEEVPGSVHYMDRKDLQVFNYANVNNVLKQIPGVYIQEEDGFGLRPNIGLRGSGLERSSKITLMEDGILAAPAPYAAPSAYYFPTTGRMSGVEVLKGSSQIRFGPFTTGGAINFISTPIPSEREGFISYGIGNFNFYNLHAHFGDAFNNVAYVVEAFTYGSDGFKSVPNGDAGFDKRDVNVKFRVNTNPDADWYQSLTVSAGGTSEVSDETYLGLTRNDFNNNPYQRYASSQIDQMKADQQRFSVQHYLEIPNAFNVITTAYRNDFRRNWYKLQSVNGSGLGSILSDPLSNADAFALINGTADADSSALAVRANNRKYYAQGIQTTIDIEFETGSIQHDVHISTRYHEDQEDRFQWEDGYGIQNGIMNLVQSGDRGSQANRVETARAWANYIFYKLIWERWTLTPGVRTESVAVTRENFGSSDPNRTGINASIRTNHVSAWLPGISLSYAWDQTNLFAGVHKGFAPAGSQGGVLPENSTNYEVGARLRFNDLRASAVVFVNDYENLIGQDNASAGGIGSGEVFNAGEARTSGFEFQLFYPLIKSDNWSLPLTFNYTYTDAVFNNTFSSDFDGWGDVISGDDIPYVARHQWYAQLSFEHRQFQLSLNSRYQSDVRTSPGSGDIPEDQRIDGFLIMDFAANIFVTPQTTLFGSIQNLTDEVYAVADRPAGLRPGLPRAFRIGANIRF